MIKILQIRIADADGDNPVILDRATSRKFSESINLSNGGISFSIAKSDPKADIVNPYTVGYTKRWEVWDTQTNTLLDFGPIASIDDTDTMWAVTGPGRAGYLTDFYKSKKTFYIPIADLIEDLTLENIAVEPKTSTIVAEVNTSAAQTTVMGSTVTINERYHSLSKQTKDNVIDDDNGLILPGQIEPPNTYYSSNTFWSGMGKADTHVIDLGANFEISKLIHTFPDWAGIRRRRNRTYDYSIAVATDSGSTTAYQDRDFGTFTTVYSTAVPNRLVQGPSFGGLTLYIGDNNGTIVGSEDPVSYPPATIRYIRTQITNVRSWEGGRFDDTAAIDVWEYDCNPDYVQGSIPSLSGAARMKDDINDRTLEPPNDCYASIIEVGAYQEIVPIANVEPLALQRIDNNSVQIRYTYNPVSGKTTTTDSGFRKFEPGGFFRKATLTWSSAAASHTKFFASDCDGCYPDGARVSVMDQNNSLVYRSTSASSGGTTIRLPASTKHILIKGAANATVTYCDSWPARVDALSWGGSYAYNEVTNDTAVVHFKGRSFRWYATVPSSKTGAQVRVEIRSKSDANDINEAWSSYSTLSTFTLPNNISSQIVYEITYESGILTAGKIYEIKITNLDGNFCSIDSIEGYWEGSMVEYNEDSSRIFVASLDKAKQIYDKRFSNGSMYKFTQANWISFEFTGDRVIVLSAKGRNHGKVDIVLIDRSQGSIYDPGPAGNIMIPGGDPVTGTLEVNLDTGAVGNEIPQYVLFDSDEHFTNGLPWNSYTLGVYLLPSKEEMYTSDTADIEFDSFVSRCKDCEPASGNNVQVVKPIFLDSIFVHERLGMSVSFTNETHLEILRSTAEVLQVEASIDATGLTMKPRLGEDTDIILQEGNNTLVNWNISNDVTYLATMLVSSGADIDGLPLFTITENRKTRQRMGRTIMRQHDFRGLADYMQLIGVSRSELERRAYPQKRINVSHIGNNLALDKGDSFLLWTKKLGSAIRVRILEKEIDETNGRVYNLECVTWPQIA